MRNHRWVLAAAFILGSCGTSSITNDDDGDGGGSTTPDARAADARDMCTSALQCAAGSVCNPSTSKCTANLSCTMHAMCGHQAFCDDGKCALNMLRGVCDTTDNCVGEESCQGGRCGCGGELLSATAVAPNMLVALDRSDSMVTNNVPNSGGKSRWTVAKEAIKALTGKYQGGIRFGLNLWPGNNKDCEGGGSNVCKGQNFAVTMNTSTASAIGGYLDTATTCNLMTPIGGTLATLVGYAQLGDTMRDNYVVIVTDGADNCGNDGDGSTEAGHLLSRTPPVKTFVIGFGGSVDSSELNEMAVAGGTARPGTTKYYQADDQAALDDAFEEIAGAIASCSYTLSGNPDDPNRVYVFIGDTMVARDTTHARGWDFEAASKRLTFYGATCDQVRSGTGGALTVSFGCPIVP